MNEQEINEFSTEVFKANLDKGWWDDLHRPILQVCQLISSELAEATEGFRTGVMDNHVKSRLSEEVELGDALIRTLDLGGRYKLQFHSPDSEFFNELRKKRFLELASLIDDQSDVVSCHFVLNKALTDFGMCLYFIILKYGEKDIPDIVHERYSILVQLIISVSKKFKYDLFGAVFEKFEVNKVRPDHTREARAGKHGKKC
mgnify:CR=1 FL=1